MALDSVGAPPSARWLWILWERRPRRDAAADQSLRLASVHLRLREVAHALQLSRTAFVLKIGLPNALPDILAGMRLSITVSLIVAVVGEMIASQSGLGQAILLAARSFRANELFAGIVLLGLIGFFSNALLALAERRLLKWQAP